MGNNIRNEEFYNIKIVNIRTNTYYILLVKVIKFEGTKMPTKRLVKKVKKRLIKLN